MIYFFVLLDSSDDDRQQVVKHLNVEFENHFREGKNKLQAFELMIERHSFKLSLADVDEDLSVSPFKDHLEFITLVRNAEKEAFEKGEKAVYSWRGYMGFVSPNLPKITSRGLKMRLLNALQRVVDQTHSEILVKIFLIKYIYRYRY